MKSTEAIKFLESRGYQTIDAVTAVVYLFEERVPLTPTSIMDSVHDAISNREMDEHDAIQDMLWTIRDLEDELQNGDG